MFVALALLSTDYIPNPGPLLCRRCRYTMQLVEKLVDYDLPFQDFEAQFKTICRKVQDPMQRVYCQMLMNNYGPSIAAYKYEDPTADACAEQWFCKVK